MRGTLEDRECLENLVEKADAVVHCAGAVRGITEDDFNRINVEAVSRLASIAARQHPAPRFLLISSLAAREPEVSPYAASKRMGELVLSTMPNRLPWTALRPPVVYGPEDRAVRPLLYLMLHGIAPILGRKDARFSMLYVEDLAEAVIHWLVGNVREERAFELDDGHPKGYSWHEVVEIFQQLRGKRMIHFQVPELIMATAARLNKMVASMTGGAPMFTPGKMQEFRHLDWTCDSAPFRRIVNWMPRVRLEEGLRLTLGLPLPGQEVRA